MMLCLATRSKAAELWMSVRIETWTDARDAGGQTLLGTIKNVKHFTGMPQLWKHDTTLNCGYVVFHKFSLLAWLFLSPRQRQRVYRNGLHLSADIVYTAVYRHQSLC